MFALVDAKMAYTINLETYVGTQPEGKVGFAGPSNFLGVLMMEMLMVLLDLVPNLEGESVCLWRCLGSVCELLLSTTELFTKRPVDLLNLPRVLWDL
nr:unnamed protein product [Callosobruchus analis]